MTSPTFEPGGNLPAPLGTTTAGPAFAPSGGGGIVRTGPLARFIAALKRFKWLVIALFLVGLLGGILMTRMLPPKYQVMSTLTLEVRGENSAGPIEGR